MIRLDMDAAADVAERRSTWESAVGEALSRLDQRTVEGLTVAALADPTAPQRDRGLPGQFPFVRGLTTGGWDVRSWVRTPQASDAAGLIDHDLREGATSVWVTVGGDGVPVDQLGQALSGVFLDAAPVVVQARGDVSQVAAADAFAQVLAQVEVRHPRHHLGVDPFAAGRLDEQVLAHGIRRALELGVRGLVVDATKYADQGAGDASEIGFAVAAGLAAVRAASEAGIDPVQALQTLEFRLAVTDDQMVSIAKLRAARLLWSGALREAGIDGEQCGMSQHAVTSRPMMTRYDSWTNLLRTTVAAFAAGAGGAESITVLPFDVALGQSTSLSRRLARNISTLLLEESHLPASADPAGGAYAVEQLTDTLAAHAWEQVQRIERVGGFDAALADGTVADVLAGVAAKRAERVRRRRQALTGVSEFPLADEHLPERVPWQHPDPVVGWADEFEALRDDAAETPVLVATMGSVAQHTARASFAANLCAAGGIRAVSAGATAGPAEVAQALRDAGTSVAILAGADSQYDADGAEHVAALREAGATWVVLAGKPGADLANLVDDHIAAGQDAVAACQTLRARLNGDPA